MLMIRPMAWLAAVVVLVGWAASASAQGVPTSPGSGKLWQFQPLRDPGYFEPDFQFFAPAEVDDFGGEEKPNTGLYVTFDRTYINVTRPIDQFSFGSGNQGDFTWGNRMEAGYMTEEDKGWQAVLWHVNGPNERFANSTSQVPLTDGDGANNQNFLIDQAFDSINVLKMSSFELNRVWRRPQFHNGTQFEPLLGYRYMNVKDFFQRQIFEEVPVVIPPLTEFFALQTDRSIFENQMHGGQLGARIYRQRGHWMLSADIKFFAMANFQSLRRIAEESFLPRPGPIVDVIGPLPLPFPTLPTVGGDVNRVNTYDRASQFCFGGEVKAEASYELTRDINLRFGAVFLDLGQGIGRGNLMRLNNQAVQMAGVTFGFTVNR
jgi:Putative beta barrel porin-7 (BBP7)